MTRKGNVTRKDTVVCPKCGQRGDERPGLQVDYTPRAVIFRAGSAAHEVATHNITCAKCGFVWPEPVGSFTVITPEEHAKLP